MSMDSNALSDVQCEETNTTSSKQSKISYTRGHLLSLSCLEVCKRLPKDFDKSLLSEFEAESHATQERGRTPGSLPMQGHRHNNDNGSSPPSKGEISNFSRGPHRWDSRSGGRSDTDSQSDRDSDSGRRYGNQYRRPWQNSEHDGLLGNGSFQRPPRHGSSASVPGFGANDQDQLSRKSDPYHPPRPYKAVPHIRRETKDSYNDETFGSDECTSEDKVEEEKKRRAEFEMMRKEQQKELQEKLKSKSVDKLKDNPLSEFAASSDIRDAKMGKGLDKPLMEQVEQDDYSKISVSSHSEPSRPVVPPGFANAAVVKASAPKSFRHSDPVQVEMPELGDGNHDEKSALKPTLVDNRSKNKSSLENHGKRVVDLSLACGSIEARLPDDQIVNASNNVDTCLLENHADTGIDPRNATLDKIMGEAGRSAPTSQRIVGGTLSINGGNVSNSFKSMKTDDFGNRKGFHSSKFAQWFPEEEKEQAQKKSSDKSNDLLSLIVNERRGPAAPETSSIAKMLPLESNLENLFPTPNSPAVIPEQLRNKNKPETLSAVLTCEDLERSMLSEIGENSSGSQPPDKIYGPRDVEIEKPISDNVNSASQILSLLGKGISPNSTMASPISKLEKPTPEAYQQSDIGRNTEIQGNNDEYLNRSGKDLTLETFFGKDFMKELHSLDAPVSVQGNSATIVSIGVSDHNVSTNEGRSERVNNDDGISRLGGRHGMNLEKVGVNWVSFDSSLKEVQSSLNVPTDIWLPKDDSLISVNDHVNDYANAQSSIFKGNAGIHNLEMERSSLNTSFNIAEKLAALGASMKDDSLHGPGHDSLLFPPSSMVNSEYPYPNIHAFSSPQFDPTPPVNHGRPMLHPLDSHTPYIDPQLNFMMQKGIIHHDDPNHHQFHPNPNHSPYLQPNSGVPAFDHSSFPTGHQMSMSTNLPPPHLLHGFLGGAPPRPRDNFNPPGYIQEGNPIGGLSYSQLQPNLGGLGIHHRGPEQGVIDNGPPDTFHRLVEMERRRSNPKPMHPSFPADGGHTHPMFGHELDTGFGYR